MSPGLVVLRKQLNGYANYGAADAAADILDDGAAESWLFQIPNVTVLSASVRLGISADDHASVPIDTYDYDVWVQSTCVAGAEGGLDHGMPAGQPFSNWGTPQFPADVQPGMFVVVTLANRSMTPTTGNWIATDWVELRLVTP